VTSGRYLKGDDTIYYAASAPRDRKIKSHTSDVKLELHEV
jgi:hypothetical protein